ncbi:hypothetical protein AVEN_213861-1 [Araneus ventricosus]|uniref:Uncharacterized protein n=1 Tax=Araneus ventricosus TaxID=182803 RepID=A0A4Y2IJJ7_ARAVE|nr:hypothetical protein AVEN_213861-1 [Araneus ventricosus]
MVLGGFKWQGPLSSCIRVFVFTIAVGVLNLRRNEFVAVIWDFEKEFSREFFDELLDRFNAKIFVKHFITHVPRRVGHDSEDFILENLDFIMVTFCSGAPDLS